MPAILFDQTTFETAVAALLKRDGEVLAKLQIDQLAPTLRRREAGFEGLASIIVAQQVSTASAKAIFGRLKTKLGGLDAVAFQAARTHPVDKDPLPFNK